MDTSTLMAAIAVMKNMPDNAAASAAAAAESAEAAQEVLNNIPQDYTELSEDVGNLLSAVEELEDETVDDVWDSVSLTIQNGYYQYGNGNFVSDDWERTAVVSGVTAGETYKVTTHIKSVSVAGIVYKDTNGTVIDRDLVGNGTDQDYTDYQFTIPSGCVTLIVQSSNTTAPTLKKKGTSFKAYTKAESDAKYLEAEYGDKVDDLEDTVYADDYTGVSLTEELGYYQYGNGVFVPEIYRRSATVSVTAGETYKVTTHTKTSAISGIIYKNLSGTVIGHDLDGTGSDQDHTDYQFSIPNNCVTLIVQSSTTTMPILKKRVDVFAAYTKSEADARFATRSSGGETIAYMPTQTIYVGSDALGSASSSDGWTESSGAYTHASGNTNVLVFDTTAVQGDDYLLEFDSVTSDETVRIGLGDTAYRLLIYTDYEHKYVPLRAYGNCKLYIEPLNSSYTGTISNLILRPIQSTGTEVELTTYNTLTDNHTANYGFYNTLIGKNTAENSPGTTRTVAIGMNALRDLQGGHRNIGIGTFAMSQMIGGEANVSIGADSMLGVQKAEGVVAIGKSALYNGVENKYDTAIGHFAGMGSSGMSVEMCTMIGAFAGHLNKGNYNTFVGANAGYNVTTGKRNTFVGANITGRSTGDDNTCIGRYSTYPSGGSHCIALGVSAECTKSNQMMLGSSNVTEVVFCGNKKINFNQDGTVTWEQLE